MKKRLFASGVLFLIITPLAAQQTNDVVVFGDSLSDPGNIPSLSGGVNFPPLPPYAGNRFSNGLVYSEILPGLLGRRFNRSLNFATGGALTGADNLNSDRPSPDPGSDLSGITLPGIETQVDGFLAGGGRLRSDDLAIVYGGANDILVAADLAATLPADQIPALVQSTAATAAGNISTSVGKLRGVGGDFFILPNLPDIGTTPAFAAGGPDSVLLGSSFTTAHNLALDQAALGLEEQTSANIIVFDIEAIIDDMQTNPDRYGLTNVTDACIETPTCLTGGQDTQNQFLFFDGVHPTTGVHGQIAQVLSTAIRAPQTLAAQGDITLVSAENFQRLVLGQMSPDAELLSIMAAHDQASPTKFDSANLSENGFHRDRQSDLFMLASLTDGDRDERAGALGYQYDLGAWTAGIRHRLSRRLLLGGALSVGSGDVEIDGGDERFDHRQVQVGLSATFVEDRSYIAGLANIGYAEIRDIERQTGIDDLETSGSTEGFIYGLGIAAGHLISITDDIRLGPIGSLRYTAVDLDGYIEDGPTFLNQNVEDQDDIEALVLSIGTALEVDWDPRVIRDLRFRLSALLEHDFEEDDRTIESSFVTSPTTLETSVAARDQTTSRLGADVGFRVTQGINLGFSYETLVGLDDGNEHSIIGRAVIRF